MTTGPGSSKMQATLPALGAAVTGDQIVGEAQYDGVVTGVTFTPEGDVTGNTTNTRTLTLINKGQDGNGTTVIATLALITATNLTDFNETAFTLSAVANATKVVAGDILAVAETVGASGLANPGGRIEVSIAPTYA